MKESDFALEMKHSFERAMPCRYKKNPDQIFNPSSNARFNPEKDYDAECLYQGQLTAIEYKLHKKKGVFPLSAVSLIQKTALLDVSEHGGNAYVVIGVRYDQIKEAYFMPIKEFMKFTYSTEKKSISIDEMRSSSREAKWLGKGFWSIDCNWFKYESR